MDAAVEDVRHNAVLQLSASPAKSLLSKKGLNIEHLLCTQARSKKKHNGLLVLASARGYLADVGTLFKSPSNASAGSHISLPYNLSLSALCRNTGHGMAASDLKKESICNNRLD